MITSGMNIYNSISPETLNNAKEVAKGGAFLFFEFLSPAPECIASLRLLIDSSAAFLFSSNSRICFKNSSIGAKSYPFKSFSKYQLSAYEESKSTAALTLFNLMISSVAFNSSLEEADEATNGTISFLEILTSSDLGN
ncbi:unnamed protein product [Ambrosiozyma monospora]|uniref:Unnamed protein product n=1 Tax=Ambrosiozyma monospora TaxID=43982 RepID=A0ACB5U4P2_AMBMO|nr:unnamed protein product [Ambrosiozyma monospora]